MHLSVVIPAYNESAKIQKDLEKISAYLSTKPFESEVLIVNDGSQDATASVIQEFINRAPKGNVTFRLLDYGENRGKGHAVRYGILRSEGEFVAFVDAGLCVPFEDLENGLAKLESGADYAIGSRRHPKSEIRVAQPMYRRWGSLAFSWVVRHLMGVHFVTDTQCGFKLYKGAAGKAIFSNVQTDGFMFDTEALLVAHALKLKVAEFPVHWSNDSDTRYDPVLGTIKNLRELAKIRFRSLTRLQRLQIPEVL